MDLFLLLSGALVNGQLVGFMKQQILFHIRVYIIKTSFKTVWSGYANASLQFKCIQCILIVMLRGLDSYLKGLRNHE